MLNTAINWIGDLFGYLSFWWLALGLVFIFARMNAPGMKLVDKKKFLEKKQELDDKLASHRSRGFIDKLVDYSGRYFFIYHYYRNDIFFIFVIIGAMFMKFVSLLFGAFNA